MQQIKEDFKSKNWIIGQHAEIPENSTWLQLTPAVPFKMGTATLNKEFDINENIEVRFTYASYGGNGADGICVIFFDGNAQYKFGYGGGSFGYDGAQNQYFGIGFDEFGNFSRIGNWRRSGIGIRNAANDVIAYYPFGVQSAGQDVAITLQDKIVKVYLWLNQKWKSVLECNLQQFKQPDSIRIGFAGVTGGQTNVHAITDVIVRGTVIGEPIETFKRVIKEQQETINQYSKLLEQANNKEVGKLMNKQHQSQCSDVERYTAHFMCPLCLSPGHIMNDPVVATDGNTYDRQCINKYFAKHPKTSPISGAQLLNENLTQNVGLRNMIAEFRKSHKDQ